MKLRGAPDDPAPRSADDDAMLSPKPTEISVPFSDASVADAMSHGVIHCAPETPLRVVARMMATYGVHAVYVFDYGDEDDNAMELWGLVSDLNVGAAGAGESEELHCQHR